MSHIFVEIICVHWKFCVPLHRLRSETKQKQKRMGGDAYMEKVSTMALLSLTLQCLANKKVYQRRSNCRCSWVCIAYACMMSVYNRLFVVYTYTCGLLRCSSLIDGQCETPEEWDEQQVQWPTLFVYMYQIKSKRNQSCSGFCETQKQRRIADERHSDFWRRRIWSRSGLFD